MELMYIWARIKNGDKEQKFSFNFSRTHEVTHLKDEYKIKVEERKFYNVFSEKNKGVNQVYALVGKNGCGKTTFLRSLIQQRSSYDSSVEIIYLFKGKSEYIIESEVPSGIYVRRYKNVGEKDFELKFGRPDFPMETFNYDGKNIRPPFKKKEYPKNIIYYSPSLGNYLFQNDRAYKGSDLSYENKVSRVESASLFRHIWDENLRNIYKMFGKIKDKEKLDNINKILKKEEVETELFQVYFHGVSDNHNVTSDKDFINMGALNFEEYVPEILRISDVLKNSLIEYYKSLFSAIKVLVPEYWNKELVVDVSFENIEEIVKKIEVYKMAQCQAPEMLKERIELFKNYRNDVKLICEEFTKNIAPKMIDKKEENCYRINRDQISDSDELLDKVIEMSSAGFIGINTGFSDGQWNLLKLLGNIYNHIGKYAHEKDEILILLDEGDMGFHPEWQREYIDILVKFFNEVWGEEKRINLILASHSPFIASDLPTENLIFLGDKEEVKKAKDMKTFGANIHELYENSFFMDSTMGEFAMGKIRGVIEDLTTLECVQRAERSLEKLERKEEKDLSKKEKEERDELRGTQEERGKVKGGIETRKDEIKYIIDNVGDRCLSGKLEEKYIEVFEESLSPKERKENNLREKWNKLSDAEKLVILEEKLGGTNA